MKPYRFTRAPRALRKAKLDNVAIVPASLIPFKRQWQEYANTLSGLKRSWQPAERVSLITIICQSGADPDQLNLPGG